MKIHTYQEALDRVFTIEETRDYSLDRVKKAIELLGNPLNNIKVIHVAGTNGKGSTSKMCFAVLKYAGKKVGAFTQPHLIDIKERFITDDGEITQDEFVEGLNKILELDLEFSFFEKAFLLSCLLFEKRAVEYAIIEVGFGGLLDSTNVVSPTVTAITSIGLDHTKILGNTIEEISFQKAGIIKTGIPIIYNHQNSVIKKVAEERNAPIIFTQKLIDTNLVGEYQRRNAAIAFEICKFLGITEEDITAGLQKVEHFGRLQYITDNLVIDGAHNEQGLMELNKYLSSLEGNNVQLCFAQKKGKDGSKIIKEFGENYQDFILIESGNKLMVEKATILKEGILHNIDSSLRKFKTENFQIKTPQEIFKLSQENKNTLYIVFGSLYMIGEFLEFIKK